MSSKSVGPALDPPNMPFPTGSTLKAQLLSLSNSQCWESAFSLPTQNTTDMYKADSD